MFNDQKRYTMKKREMAWLCSISTDDWSCKRVNKTVKMGSEQPIRLNWTQLTV